jgi:hypothetical protein
VVTVAASAVGGSAYACRDLVRALFGPPAVVMAEVYEEDASGPVFDHRAFEALLRKYVDDDGGVEYAGLAGEAARLDAYIDSVSKAPFDQLGRDEKLALLINAYNAFTLRLIIEYHPVRSIRDIPASKRWEDRRWNVGGHVWSLNQIEHEQIRPKFNEPRIHFALVCAAVGCPPLRTEAYTAERLEDQLEDQTRHVHGHDRWYRYDHDRNVVELTKLYDWYRGDFEQAAGSVTAYAAAYSADLKRALAAGAPPKVRWLEYDWSLNDKRDR